jgi:hypothetical protein
VADVRIDSGLLQWLVGGISIFFLWLLSLVVKDIKSRLDKLPTLCVEIERLNGRIQALEQRVDDLRDN